jgi:Di-haem oxidoreductase, putative peroxidase
MLFISTGQRPRETILRDRVIRVIGTWKAVAWRTAAIMGAGLALGATAQAQQGLSHAEDPTLSRHLRRIDQDKLLQGRYPLRQIMENGRHLFSTPFTKAEGYGEGGRPDGQGGFERGPREQMFLDNLEKLRQRIHSDLPADQLREFFNFPVPQVNSNTRKIGYSYVRLNGLDSQSCFECHNSIGSERLPDSRSFALTRKQSTVGGPAGFASNAFINDDLGLRVFTFIRNPPHVFGTGYAQGLAEEMTVDLLGLRTKALEEALASGKGSVPLESKGTKFGEFSVAYTGGDPKPELNNVIKQLNEHPGQDPPGFKIDWGKIEGVSVDLVVRPFQWKGIASNERNFVRDACQFHFGMQAQEKNMQFGESSEDHDSDKDGVCDELSIGDISAMTIYTMTIRPPFEVKPIREDERRTVARGRKIFQGEEVFTKEVSCARCHTPSLRLNDSIVVVRDPRKDIKKYGSEQLVGNGIGLSARFRSSAQLPSVRRFMDLSPAAKVKGKDAGGTLESLRKARSEIARGYFKQEGNRQDGYAFDLTTLQPANLDAAANQQQAPPLSESQPRLPADGTMIDVPLFSDLRRHKMGNGLREHDGFRQGTDVQGITVAEDEFLTRPLWGVGDTGPWLHDGRAQSLREAILLHQSDGSEANDVIDAFKKLSDQDQQAIISFLLCLRLPLDPRYGFDDFR